MIIKFADERWVKLRIDTYDVAMSSEQKEYWKLV
jgi:hypothetical protein